MLTSAPIHDRFAGDSELELRMRQFNWDYVVHVDQPRPRADGWMLEFAESVDALDLFPCRRRFTSEPPGWMPIRYHSGVDTLAILIAVPPGAWRGSIAAFEKVLPVFDQAVRAVFNESKSRVRPITPLQIDGLLERIGKSHVEFTTAFTRKHHETCPEISRMGLEANSA